jgi:hypothetical protein
VTETVQSTATTDSGTAAADPATLTPTAQRLHTALTSEPGNRRLTAADVTSAFARTFPATAGSTRGRSILAVLLVELDTAGVLRLPKSPTQWDRGSPLLPQWVRIPPTIEAQPRTKPTGIAWRPELAWAATARLTTTQTEDLRKINRWLRDNDTDAADIEMIPMRERSVEIFDDEKHLDRLHTSALFAPNRLSLAMLRAVRIPPPLAIRRIGDGPVLLVVENSDTFATLAALLAERPGRVGHIAFGGGRAFEASVLGIDETSGIEEIRYFGDLDADGLSIPAHAEVTALTAGLPPVQPAPELYRLLLEQHSQPTPRAVPEWSAEALCAWLPEDLRSRAATLLTGGRRIAQERVGRTLLRSTSRWHDGGFPQSHLPHNRSPQINDRQ